MSFQNLPAGKKALLLDMNGTFMFGHDRFSKEEDYYQYYRSTGGNLDSEQVRNIVESAYGYLDSRYADQEYRYRFPSLEYAIRATDRISLDENELDRIVETFSFHEMGYIPEEYAGALKSLAQQYSLGLVSDLWSPKHQWQKLLDEMGLSRLFTGCSFSSDHGTVKPAAEPFEEVLHQLKLEKNQAIVIGDSIRRDLGGALAAGIDCILVGGACHQDAVSCLPSLLDLTVIS